MCGGGGGGGRDSKGMKVAMYYVCVFVCMHVYIDPRGFSQDFSVCVHVYRRTTYATCKLDDPLPMDCSSQLP